MRRVTGPIDRVAAAGRRVTGAPEWPLAAAALLALLAMVEVVLNAEPTRPTSGDDRTDLTTALLLSLGATAPVAAARTHVLAAAATTTAATVLSLATGGRLTAAGLVALLVLLYLLGLRRPLRISAPVVLPFAGYALAAGELGAVLLLGLTVAAVGLGSARRVRGEAAERDASSRAIADTLLEHAARGERARIARELHDVVAHHISMIAVQAETARLTTPGMPAEGAKRLAAIGDTAREALSEMRRLLGVLREDAGTETTRRPQPGIAQLLDLVDEARGSTRASTRLIVRGPVAPLDPGVELTAYRIVQESLTNARRHAPGAAVDVELHYTAEALYLRVRDNGPGPSENGPPEPGPAEDGQPAGPVAAGAAPSAAEQAGGERAGGEHGVGGRAARRQAAGGRVGGGLGLVGMRERAAMVGGQLRTGPAPAGGFLVEAVLPTAKAAE
jgi:signal transduction histidine kinase